MRSPIYPEIEMKKIVRHGVEIEYCPKSGGVWLDHGELEKLLSLNEKEYDELAPQFGDSRKDRYDYDGDDYRHDKHKPRKRESILSEVFDIF